MALTVSCGLLDDIGRQLGDDILRAGKQYGDDGAQLARSKWVPPSKVPSAPTRIPMSKIEEGAIDLAAPVSSVPEENQAAAVWAACTATDVIEAGTSAEEAVNYALQQAPGAAGYRATVEDLTENLLEADDELDAAMILGRALLCEAVGA